MTAKQKKKRRDIKYKDIVKNWGNVDIQAEISAKIDEWINNFSSLEQTLLIELLYHYSYYSDNKISECIKRLYQKYMECFSIAKEDIVFIPVFDDMGIGNSDEFFNRFWLQNNLRGYCTKNIYTLLKEEQKIRYIAIVDDYSGSGKSIKNTISKCLSSRRNQKLEFFILTIHISKTALLEIKAFEKKAGVRIEIIYLFVDDKCFDSNYVYNSPEERADKKNKYSAIWKTYKYKKKKYEYGFNGAQGLLSFEYDTPNDTLGIFWCDNESIKPLFRRTKRERTTLRNMQKDANRRKAERKDDRIIFADKPATLMYMLSTIQETKVIHYEDTRIKCGLSIEEMDKNLNYLIENKMISYKSGQLVISDEARKLAFPNTATSLQDNVKKEFREKEYLPKNIKEVFNGYKNSADT